jgi:hypothetical protein
MCFAAPEKRDTTMQYGVEEGAKSGFARVDALLQRLQMEALDGIGQREPDGRER